jgi:hypothetical protein
MTRIIMRLAGEERPGPDRISFGKVLKHVRRSVIRQCAQTSVQIRQFMATMAAKVCRKPGNGVSRASSSRCSAITSATPGSSGTSPQHAQPELKVQTTSTAGAPHKDAPLSG